MALGTKLAVTIRRAAVGGAATLVGLTYTPITLPAGFVSTTSVVKNDIIGSVTDDEYTVTFTSLDSGPTVPTTETLAALVTRCGNAVYAAIGEPPFYAPAPTPAPAP